VPRAPLRVRIGATRDSMLTVSYELPSNNGGDEVTSFKVEWDTAPNFDSISRAPHKGSVVKLSKTSMFHTISGLTPGMTYFVRVAAGNKVGFGAFTSDSPAGRALGNQVPGKPYDISAAASGSACAAISVHFAAPVVPAHGLACGGGGTDDPSSVDMCPVGMGYSRQSDGGMRILQYVVQYSMYSDFRTATTVFSSVLPGLEDAPVGVVIGPSSGQDLQSDIPYYVRVASKNSVGVGPFCSRQGVFCDGRPIVATAAAC
jgi:hypothetical protein